MFQCNVQRFFFFKPQNRSTALSNNNSLTKYTNALFTKSSSGFTGVGEGW